VVGLPVGDRVESWNVGAIEGAVGRAVDGAAVLVGAHVGATEGCLVGATLTGARVGDAEGGLVDGAALGEIVGGRLGGIVGGLLGPEVGLMVGG